MLSRCPDVLRATELGDDSCVAHLNADDVDALYEHALAAGAEVLKTPTDERWGMRELALRSPDGHTFILAGRSNVRYHAAAFHAKGHSSPIPAGCCPACAPPRAPGAGGGRFARAGEPRSSRARSHPLAHILGGSDRRRAARAGTTGSTPRVGASPSHSFLTYTGTRRP